MEEVIVCLSAAGILFVYVVRIFKIIINQTGKEKQLTGEVLLVRIVLKRLIK
jgi:hypothetical protein